MPVNAALFLFLAAAVVAVFAFCSIFVWVSTPSRERQARDRLALLKTLAETPGENARQVFELLRQEDERRIARRQAEDRRSKITGGLIVMAVGVGLGMMLELLATPGHGGTWTIGLLPFLVGCVLLGDGLVGRQKTG